MKVYEEIRQHLLENETSILYSEWKEKAGEAAGLTQHVELREPTVPANEQEAEVFRTGKPVLVTKEDGTTVLAEPFFPEERLIVLGGGHVALPLVEFAAKSGFSVTIVDDREEFANEERFPWAEHVVCEGFVPAIKKLKIRKQDYVCILTRGHRWDSDCLRAIMDGEEPGYLGMIGSRRRVAVVKEDLIAEGYPAEILGRLHSPIGLKIGAVTPAEIAVCILAELIQEKRLGISGKARQDQSDVDYSVARRLAEEKNVPKAVMTIIAAEGSAPRGAGAKMLVYPNGMLGSIGGGGSEAVMMKIARQLIGTGTYRVEHLDLTSDAAAEDGMVCGGVMDVLIQDVPVEIQI